MIRVESKMEWLTQLEDLKKLNGYRETFKAIVDGYNSYNMQAGKYILWLLEADSPESLKAKFENIEVNISTESAKEVFDLIDKIHSIGGNKFEALFVPLSLLKSNDAEIVLSVLSGDKSTNLAVGDLALALSAKADSSITFDADAIENYSDKHNVVSVLARGELVAKVEGSYPVPIGAISGFSNFDAKASMFLAQVADKSKLFIEALYEISTSGLNPFDISTYNTSNFHSVAFNANGKLSIGGKVNLAFQGVTGGGLPISVASETGFKKSISGDFTLEVSKFDNNNVDVTVKRAKQVANEVNHSLGVSLDANSITKSLKKNMEAWVAEYGSELDRLLIEIDEIALPSEYYKVNVEQWLDNLGLGQDVSDTLKVVLGVADDGGVLSKLSEKVGEFLNEQYLVFAGDSSALAEKAVESLSESLNLPLEVINISFGDGVNLQSKIEGVLKSLDDSFDEWVTNNVKNNIDAWNEALKDLGNDVSKFIAKADTPLIKLKKDVKTLLNRFKSKITASYEYIANEANSKIDFTLNEILKESTSDSVLLKYRFDLNSDNATNFQPFFRLLFLGRASELFDAAGNTPEGITIIEGLLTESAMFNAGLAANISLFGIKISAGSLFNSESKVVRDFNGNTTITTKADYEEYLGVESEKQSVLFLDAYKAVLGKQNTRKLDFALRTKFEDKKTSLSEINDLLQSLVSYNWLEPTKIEKITSDFKFQSKGMQKVKTVVSVNFPLQNEDVLDYLGLMWDDQQAKYINQLDIKNCFSYVLKALVNVDSKKLKKAVKKIGWSSDIVANAFANRDEVNLSKLENAVKKTYIDDPILRAKFNDLPNAVRKAAAFVTIREKLQQIFLANNTMTRNNLIAIQKEIKECIAIWVSPAKDLLNIVLGDFQIMNQTRTFVDLVQIFADKDVDSPIIPQLVIRYENATLTY